MRSEEMSEEETIKDGREGKREVKREKMEREEIEVKRGNRCGRRKREVKRRESQ
jgi:hypothetical protein